MNQFLLNPKLVLIKKLVKENILNNNLDTKQIKRLADKIEHTLFNYHDSITINNKIIELIRSKVDPEIYDYVKIGINNFHQLDLIDRFVLAYVLNELCKHNYKLIQFKR